MLNEYFSEFMHNEKKPQDNTIYYKKLSLLYNVKYIDKVIEIFLSLIFSFDQAIVTKTTDITSNITKYLNYIIK